MSQISPQPPDRTSRPGLAPTKPRRYDTAASPARFMASRAGEETEVVTGSGSESEDENDEQQGAAPAMNGHAAG